MPLQRAVERDALPNQPLAVIDQQPQIELRPVQMRDREGLKALPQGSAGDGKRVDGVRLAALTSTASGLCGQVRRDPQHPLAAADQEPLQRPRDVPAVLKCPDPLAIKAARPPKRGIEPAPADRDGLLAQQLPGRGRDSGDRVRTLVSVRAKHDHGPRPPLDPLGADARRTRLAGGSATHLSSHARHPRPATSDKTKGSQALPGRQPQRESARRPAGTITSASDAPTARIETASLIAEARRAVVRLLGALGTRSPRRLRPAAAVQRACAAGSSTTSAAIASPF